MNCGRDDIKSRLWTLCVVGKCHTGGEVLMDLRSHTLWNLKSWPVRETVGQFSSADVPLASEAVLVGCFVDILTYIYIYNVLNTPEYQCFWGRSISTVRTPL